MTSTPRPRPSSCWGLVLVLLLVTCAGTVRAEGSPARDAAAFETQTKTLMTVLAGWSLGSVSAGVVMTTSDDRAVRFAGIQNIAWGAVDGAIAAVALVTTRPEDDVTAARRKLARLFWINAALDVAYVVTGVVLASTSEDARVTGSGAAVVTQGGFLLGFDLTGALLSRP